MGASGASAGPGYPLQFLSPLRGLPVFPLLSLALLKNGIHAIFEL
jgi:hypothetical protein